MIIEPFVKWPGGKRWLIYKRGDIFPHSYGCYFEPFLGGGAVFFHLQPRKAVLSDTNIELINSYNCIKAHALLIDRHLNQLHSRHNKILYYRIRAQRPRTNINKTIRFLYLNRTCFNGLYRVNKNGDFNVPIGTKSCVGFPPDYLQSIAKRLKSAKVIVSDFEDAMEKAILGDFIFIDPPYSVMHNTNNFIKYNASIFSWSDQLRLAAASERASKRGVSIMILNANHQCIRDLYKYFGYQYPLSRSSILAANPSNRHSTTELLITNYKLSL